MLRLAPVVPLLLTAATAEDPCKCLNWKPLYEGGFSDDAKVWCGEGREFGSDTINLTQAFFAEVMPHGEEAGTICDSYKKMEDNFCVNADAYVYDSPKEDKRQWCYVSPECKDLNGGRVVSDKEDIPTILPNWVYLYFSKETGTQVFQGLTKYLHTPKVLKRNLAVKYCGAGDKKTRDMSVPEMVALGRKYDVNLNVFMKMAHAQARDKREGTMAQFSPLWEDVRGYLTPEKKDKLPKNVQKAMQNKDPIIFDTDAHRYDDSVRVIVGDEIHKIDSPCEGKKDHIHCPQKNSARFFKYHKGDNIGAFKGAAKPSGASGNTEL